MQYCMEQNELMQTKQTPTNQLTMRVTEASCMKPNKFSSKKYVLWKFGRFRIDLNIHIEY
jgi:hypothetical protein